MEEYVGVVVQMKWGAKMAIAIVIGLGVGAGGQIGVLSLVSYIQGSHLTFSYDEYRGHRDKTKPSGSVERIRLEDYDKEPFAKGSLYNICAVFPEKLTAGEASMACFFDPNYLERSSKRGQVYLEWSMPEGAFSSEVERLQGLVGPWGKTPFWSEDLFALPSCVAEYNHLSGFEYALLDRENSIIRYVWFFDIESVDNLLFPKEWAPSKILRDSDAKDYEMGFDGHFCMYQ